MPSLCSMRHAVHVVALAERAVRVDQELRHDEQRDALHAFGRVRRAREHQVDDVLGHVVLAVGDEDLLCRRSCSAVALRLGARAHQREVGAGLRLGQVHRAGPLARDHLRQVRRLQLVATRRSSASIAPWVSSGHSAKLMFELLPHLLDRGRDQLAAGPGRRTRLDAAGRSSRPRRTACRPP